MQNANQNIEREQPYQQKQAPCHKTHFPSHQEKIVSNQQAIGRKEINHKQMLWKFWNRFGKSKHGNLQEIIHEKEAACKIDPAAGHLKISKSPAKKAKNKKANDYALGSAFKKKEKNCGKCKKVMEIVEQKRC